VRLSGCRRSGGVDCEVSLCLLCPHAYAQRESEGEQCDGGSDILRGHDGGDSGRADSRTARAAVQCSAVAAGRIAGQHTAGGGSASSSRVHSHAATQHSAVHHSARSDSRMAASDSLLSRRSLCPICALQPPVRRGTQVLPMSVFKATTKTVGYKQENTTMVAVAGP